MDNLWIATIAIVLGAAGIVFMTNAARKPEKRDKNTLFATLFFFGSISAALFAARGWFRRRGLMTPDVVRTDPGVMIAASAGAGSTMA